MPRPKAMRRRMDPALFGNMHGHIIVGRSPNAPPGSRHEVRRTIHYDGAVSHRKVASGAAQKRLDALLLRHPSMAGKMATASLEELRGSAEYALRRTLGGSRAYPELLARGWSLEDIALLELHFLSVRDPRGSYESDHEYVARILRERAYNLRKWGFPSF